jgi:transposase
LVDSVQALLARCRAEIRRGLQTQVALEQASTETEPVLEEERRPARSKSVKLAQEGRRAQKLDRYTQVIELHQQGVKAADIASRVGIGERTIYRWLAHGSFPEARPRRRRPSLIDPYARYVLQWWQQGNRNGSQLYRELRAKGYKGSPRAMYNYLATLRTPEPHVPKLVPSKPRGQKNIPSSPALLENFSAQRATWLFVHHPDDLDELQKRELALIRQASLSAEAAYRLTQAFMQLTREHAGQQLETWLCSVEESILPELKSFAKGIQQDKAAVLAGLTLPWSTGPLEGHVNRLKLMKRSMYGRAKLRLLRQRVLRSPAKKRKSTMTRAA